MKNIISSVCFLLLVFIVACQNTDSLIAQKEDKFLEIASSDLFTKYKDNLDRRMYLVATKAFDETAIDRILKKYPEKLNSCDFDRNIFRDVKGGLSWYDCDCKHIQLTEELDIKYNYLQYSVDERMTIHNMYDIIKNFATRDNLREKVLNQLHNKN